MSQGMAAGAPRDAARRLREELGNVGMQRVEEVRRAQTELAHLAPRLAALVLEALDSGRGDDGAPQDRIWEQVVPESLRVGDEWVSAEAVRRGATEPQEVRVPVVAVALDPAGEYERRALLREVFDRVAPTEPVEGAVDVKEWQALAADQQTVAEFDAWALDCAVAADQAGRLEVTDPHPNEPWRESLAQYAEQDPGALTVSDDGDRAVITVGSQRFGSCPWADLVLFAPDNPAFAEYAALEQPADPAHLKARRQRADRAVERRRGIAAAERIAEQYFDLKPGAVQQSAPVTHAGLTYSTDPLTGPRIAFPVQDRVRDHAAPVAVIVDVDQGPSGRWVVEYSDGSRRASSVAIYQGTAMLRTLLRDLAVESARPALGRP
ncbi:hypothetical protein BJY21_001402 [Kineosphaera limosa]|nr:hypothetical protein [Kineosphaera limosa]NYE00218.1 hypothetical protein [Kineosphaera limosa]